MHHLKMRSKKLTRAKWIIFASLLCVILGLIGAYKFFIYKNSKRHEVRVAACLMLSNGNEIAMGLRKKENQYGLIGGHLEANETICQALLREAKEEAHITLDPQALQLVHILHCYGRHNYIFFFFQATDWQGTLQNMEPEKCAGWQWFDLQHLPCNMTNSTRIGLENIQKGLFFDAYTTKK